MVGSRGYVRFVCKTYYSQFIHSFDQAPQNVAIIMRGAIVQRQEFTVIYSRKVFDEINSIML